MHNYLTYENHCIIVILLKKSLVSLIVLENNIYFCKKLAAQLAAEYVQCTPDRSLYKPELQGGNSPELQGKTS